MSLIIDVDDIPEERSLDLDLVEAPEHFKMDASEGALDRDVEVKCSLNRVGQDIFLKGNVSAGMSLICSRCLESFHQDIHSQVSARFVLEQVQEEPGPDVELSANDIDIEYYHDHKVDLTQPIYDQIMLSLPMVRLCSEDCKGLCPQCGVSLNLQSCDCKKDEDIDPRLAVLKEWKEKIK